MTATVYRSTGSWYDLKDETGKKWKARIKGVFKIDGITSTNPIAVGDLVDFEEEGTAEQTGIITRIHSRHNYISRQSPSHKRQHHIIASNLDQSLLVATFSNPRTSMGFVDRFLVAGEAYHVPSILVMNKCDTWQDDELEQLQQWKEIYEPLGYTVLSVSATHGQGLEELKASMAGKTSLISGHSGVGKSSLLNALVPDWELRTQAVSGWSGKGMHTTTFAEMFDLPFGGQVIDTPGVREFGIVDIDEQELSHYFPEMQRRLEHCQFNNCQHINEPGCAIKEAVAQNQISEQRYISYCNMLASLPRNEWE